LICCTWRDMWSANLAFKLHSESANAYSVIGFDVKLDLFPCQGSDSVDGIVSCGLPVAWRDTYLMSIFAKLAEVVSTLDW
jgi:hypothetical protein